MKSENSFIELCMNHNKMMRMFIYALVLLGCYAIYDMPKQEFPEFTVRQGIILAVYPGATPEQLA